MNSDSVLNGNRVRAMHSRPASSSTDTPRRAKQAWLKLSWSTRYHALSGPTLIVSSAIRRVLFLNMPLISGAIGLLPFRTTLQAYVASRISISLYALSRTVSTLTKTPTSSSATIKHIIWCSHINPFLLLSTLHTLSLSLQILDRAERLRDMGNTLFSVLLRLSEMVQKKKRQMSAMGSYVGM